MILSTVHTNSLQVLAFAHGVVAMSDCNAADQNTFKCAKGWVEEATPVLHVCLLCLRGYGGGGVILRATEEQLLKVVRTDLPEINDDLFFLSTLRDTFLSLHQIENCSTFPSVCCLIVPTYQSHHSRVWGCSRQSVVWKKRTEDTPLWCSGNGVRGFAANPYWKSRTKNSFTISFPGTILSNSDVQVFFFQAGRGGGQTTPSCSDCTTALIVRPSSYTQTRLHLGVL